MIRTIPCLMLALAGGGCRSAPPEAAPVETAAPSNRATSMPASLRCEKAADCQPGPSCYWTEPACVATASVVAEECGTDQDPKSAGYPTIACDCFEGQCTPRSSEKM